jgi:hypothetical protein
VRELARTYTTVAIKTLAALMLSKKSEDLTRYYAAEALLNRGWGRPATAMTGEGGTGPAQVNITWVDEFHRERLFNTYAIGLLCARQGVNLTMPFRTLCRRELCRRVLHEAPEPGSGVVTDDDAALAEIPRLLLVGFLRAPVRESSSDGCRGTP